MAGAAAAALSLARHGRGAAPAPELRADLALAPHASGRRRADRHRRRHERRQGHLRRCARLSRRRVPGLRHHAEGAREAIRGESRRHPAALDRGHGGHGRVTLHVARRVVIAPAPAEAASPGLDRGQRRSRDSACGTPGRLLVRQPAQPHRDDRAAGRGLQAGARRVPQAVSDRVSGAPRSVRGQVAERGHPALRTVPGREVQGVSRVGSGPRDAPGRQRSGHRLRRADPRPVPPRLAR